MNTVNAPEFQRNYGFWCEGLQAEINTAHVVIGGVGGDGYQLGTKLARIGVGTITVADPEVFEPENANRVPGATTETYGRKKAEVFAEEVHKINPDVNIRVFNEGVTQDNISDVIPRGSTMAFDETELRYLQLGTMIARRARQLQIPDVLVMNVGFAGQITSFMSDSRYTFEKMMGIPAGMPIDEIAELEVDFKRCLPYLPSYVDLEAFKAVVAGAPLPSIAPGVDVASAIGTSEAILHIANGRVGWRRPTYAPRIRWYDALTGEQGSTRHPRISHYRHLLTVLALNAAKKNPITSYTDIDRERRTSRASTDV